MNEKLITGEYARWEVIWWSKKGKQFVVKEFDTDFKGALDLYMKVKLLSAPLATLRCCNVGFPPPEKYRPYNKKYLKKEKIRIKGRLRTKKRIVEVYTQPMVELNLKGVWWCPYCRELRKFKLQDGAMFEDYFVNGEGMYCPVCQIAHTDHHVRKWNPQAQLLAFKLGKNNQKRTRSSGRSTRKRSRRR
jgi:hypothetical protein